jgi:hypothetical protein
MYQVNPLNRKVLIMSDEVLFHGATSHTTDVRMIEQAIIIAEERFVKKSICKAFYEDFRNKKNVIVDNTNIATLSAATGVTLVAGEIVNAIELVTNAWYKTLWNEYLWKICAECVIYTATPTNFSEYTSQGEMINNPKGILSDGQGAVSASHKEVSWKMDKMLMDRIDPLLSSMHEWLCDNKEQFPLYTCRACACDEDGVSVSRKTGWVHGLYDNNSEKECCDN